MAQAAAVGMGRQRHLEKRPSLLAYEWREVTDKSDFRMGRVRSHYYERHPIALSARHFRTAKTNCAGLRDNDNARY